MASLIANSPADRSAPRWPTEKSMALDNRTSASPQLHHSSLSLFYWDLFAHECHLLGIFHGI